VWSRNGNELFFMTADRTRFLVLRTVLDRCGQRQRSAMNQWGVMRAPKACMRRGGPLILPKCLAKVLEDFRAGNAQARLSLLRDTLISRMIGRRHVGRRLSLFALQIDRYAASTLVSSWARRIADEAAAFRASPMPSLLPQVLCISVESVCGLRTLASSARDPLPNTVGGPANHASLLNQVEENPRMAPLRACLSGTWSDRLTKRSTGSPFQWRFDRRSREASSTKETEDDCDQAGGCE
jgi:hypothetical protein